MIAQASFANRLGSSAFNNIEGEYEAKTFNSYKYIVCTSISFSKKKVMHDRVEPR